MIYLIQFKNIIILVSIEKTADASPIDLLRL